MTSPVRSNNSGFRLSMITETHEFIPGASESGVLLIADHASCHVPDGVDLGICPSVLSRHVAIDLGVEPLVRSLAPALGAAGIVARVSRLVIDLNREEDAPGIIPHASDGIEIPGNIALELWERDNRIARYHRVYHGAIADTVADLDPELLVSIHSFTPRLETRPEEDRPWEIGILYNQDDRAARIAIPMLEAVGLIVGDNLPYSGKVLNYTMNRHAEANGIPYLGLEIRQDLIRSEADIDLWTQRLSPVVTAVRGALCSA